MTETKLKRRSPNEVRAYYDGLKAGLRMSRRIEARLAVVRAAWRTLYEAGIVNATSERLTAIYEMEEALNGDDGYCCGDGDSER